MLSKLFLFMYSDLILVFHISNDCRINCLALYQTTKPFTCFTVITFSQRLYSFGHEKRGETVLFPVTISYFSGTGNYNVSLRVNQNPNTLPSEFLLE